MNNFMPLGAAMDAVTGQPAAAVRKNDAEVREKAETTRLHDQAGFLTVSESKAADAMMDLIEEQLHNAFMDFLKEDSRGRVCHHLLVSFHHNRNLAQNAIKKLMQKGSVF